MNRVDQRFFSYGPTVVQQWVLVQNDRHNMLPVFSHHGMQIAVLANTLEHHKFSNCDQGIFSRPPDYVDYACIEFSNAAQQQCSSHSTYDEI